MKLTGIGASEGVAVGPAFVPQTGTPEPNRHHFSEDEVAPELQRFRSAVEERLKTPLAADRDNERLSRLRSADHPAVLALIRQTCEATEKTNVTELSMSALSIPRAKKVVSEATPP